MRSQPVNLRLGNWILARRATRPVVGSLIGFGPTNAHATSYAVHFDAVPIPDLCLRRPPGGAVGT